MGLQAKLICGFEIRKAKRLLGWMRVLVCTFSLK